MARRIAHVLLVVLKESSIWVAGRRKARFITNGLARRFGYNEETEFGLLRVRISWRGAGRSAARKFGGPF